MSTEHTIHHVLGLKFSAISAKAECTCGWKSHVFFWDEKSANAASAKQRKEIDEHKAKYNDRS